MKIAFVVGEPSGDRIGADLVRALRRRIGTEFRAIGLGGEEMAAEGLESLFDIEELSIVGVGAILARLPQLMGRLRETTRFVLDERPDALVIIDSPTFSHRVARRVRQADPSIPIINYVPPTVWAWREHRAAAMRAYVDHAICTLPFEPETLARLGGPPATYVGHPLMTDPGLTPLLARDLDMAPRNPAAPTLLILPGSRRGEVARLLPDFGRTLQLLAAAMPNVRALLPSVERLRPAIEAEVATWPIKPEVVSGSAAKWRAFGVADAAVAASGTVSLELALAGMPMALAYRLDPIGYRFRFLITGWTAALPNYIVGHPLIAEHFHETVRPNHLARRLERLMSATPERAAQIEGFRTIRERMAVERPPGEAAADIVLGLAERRG
ncbi:lipid-A-disaccharide synthase [Antarcticirhabdus aurantiaca]|uniref:Lipid-A-disaccharide synthase n=1 Tax=Antarcticirhabdus aurantiaca TaxID=2606717 RepID=A0ACD4NW77_9HYPH|nr:lipid-A-disaccharide synthase [Antarcticirhabdus aurantiaca]WAJ30882.1 lipid-A-disaccharide synthase [Jeongeuplla avenae]